MSEKLTQNTQKSSPPLKSGEEPDGLLMALSWSQIETLWRRGRVKIKVGTVGGVPTVAVLFSNAKFDRASGIVEAE